MKNKYLATPHIVWMIIFVLLPLFLILYFSLTTSSGGTTAFTLEYFKKAFQPQYLGVIGKSINLALKCTVICFILGYPAGYILASKEYSTKSILLFLFIAPMWMNFLLRTYSWLTILENNGIINNLLDTLGFEKKSLLYNDFSVLLGMVYNYLPFMILPIYTVLKKMDTSLIEAAQDLGANDYKVFIKIVFPLSISGIVSGITMVFMPAVTTFVISNLLGGTNYALIGNLIEKQFLIFNDWGFGSALSIILMVIILITMAVFSFVDKDKEGSGLI